MIQKKLVAIYLSHVFHGLFIIVQFIRWIAIATLQQCLLTCYGKVVNFHIQFKIKGNHEDSYNHMHISKQNHVSIPFSEIVDLHNQERYRFPTRQHAV